MENDLVCNFKKCRKRLSTEAWITSCSHIFCEEDGTREFNRAYICPACQTSLSGKYDLILVDLQPSEQHKSMLLAGQKPEVIMEVCGRALAFWTYQAQQERTYQEFIATKTKEMMTNKETYYEDVLTKIQTESGYLKSQVSHLKKELEETKQKYNDLTTKMTDKSRQYHNLQNMYDQLRRKCITPAVFEMGHDGDTISHNITSSAHRRSIFPFNLNSDEIRGIHRRRPAAVSSTPAERDFVLRPQHTPIINDFESGDPRPSRCLNHK